MPLVPALVFAGRPPLAAMGAGELWDMAVTTSLFGKLILLSLLGMSVLSWAVFIDKARQLNRIRLGHGRFWDVCDAWLEGRTEAREVAAFSRGNEQLPLSSMILQTQSLRDVPAIRRAAERVTYLEIENLERYLMLLSTAVTISPFLGLLGTVWGIMMSFWDMASMHSANLTVVAPGIAEALITTVAGLATAIPAVIFYNMLVRKIDLVGNEMDRLRSILEEEAGGGRGAVDPAARDVARRPALHDRESI